MSRSHLWYAARHEFATETAARPWCVQHDQPHRPWPLYYRNTRDVAIVYKTKEAAQKVADALNKELTP